MFYRHRAEYCLDTKIGKNGVSQARLDAITATLSSAFTALKQRKNKTAVPLLALPARTADISALTALSAEIRKNCRHVVAVGAGGSGLSGRALAALAPASATTLHFLETIDPDAIGALLHAYDTTATHFIIISKSGTTAETLAQFYVLLDQVKNKHGALPLAKHFTIITAAGDNPLRVAAKEFGITVLDHDADIGGRFSALTNVGLLPAALAGLDIARLRRGAQSVVDELDKAQTPADCQPALGAALQMAFIEKGCNITVMLPYAERLSGFSSWYRQSWAESLGKGGKGSTPIRAVGTTDQHSQLQLYLDGPRDKLFHLITVKRAGTGQLLHVPGTKDLAYLRGKTTGDIMAAEQKATLETLTKNQCPVRWFDLDALAEEHMGALLMHFTLEIIFMAGLLKVNPFDQPAVEESKRLAREYLLTGNL